MDPASEARLADLCPAFAAKIRQLALMISEEQLRVTQGNRSWAQQDADYQQGRTTPGPIITNAPAGYSWHDGFGMAADVAPFDAAGEPDWNLNHPVWKKIITAGESLGLYSGDEFCHLKDDPHFQFTGTFGVSPNDQARTILQTLGAQAVWTAAGI
jgi:D-alanyl-D-alanine carboxypeptidase